MRFGRSTRTLAAVGRRLLGERQDAEQDGIASEERLALLNSPAEVPTMEYSSEGPPAMGADPTQRLLTALGRFQRQVNRAEGGAPGHQWTDECMEQLIEGIAISHENDWQDVKEALTDAARILQSYEDAGASAQAVPFLQDSYEILCLMVGDIIVDNVRSGVMSKWRQRYTIALNELARHGVSLIDDDSADEDVPQPANIVRFAQSAPPVEERAFPFADPVMDLEEEDDDAADMRGGIQEAAKEIAAWRTEEEQEEAEDAADEVEDETTEEFDETLDEEELEDEEDEEEEAAVEEEDADLEDEEELEDDAEVEEETLEGEEDDDELETPLPALDEVIFEEAETDEETAAPTPIVPEPANVVRLGEPMRAAAPAAGDDFLFDAPAQTPRVLEAAQATVQVRDPDDDVQTMLRTAQQAMSRGDVANAKLVALQVAVKMAELEVSRAKEGLRAAEGRLEDTARAIEIASEAVRRTESGVRDVEEQISQRELEFQQKRDYIGGLREEISSVNGNIASIDEQIRALQEQRAREELNLTGLQDHLEQGLASEARIQADLDMLSQEEEAAREALDASRQRVRDLQRERLARESDIGESRNSLKSQERSVEDIQRTLQQVVAGPEEYVKETDLLF